MNNVLTRAISGAIYVAVIVLALVYGDWWLILLTFIFGNLAAYEYLNLGSHDEQDTMTLTGVLRYIDTLNIVFPLFMLFVMRAGFGRDGFTITMAAMAVFYAISIIVRFILALYDRRQNCISALQHALFGILYITIPLLCLWFVGSDHWQLALVMFVLIWLNDTGAFCVGCTMGKHKLCERLSPKKTIEGFVGGLAVCVVAAVIYALARDLNVIVYGLYGVVVGVMATYGDLFESMLKRHAGVKDAGHLIPGHGGILDRIDSLLFVAPVTMIFQLFII